MCRRLANGHARGRCMTSRATAGDIGVVHRYRTDKRSRRHGMTIVASIRCRRMRRALRSSYTARDMTINAHTGDNLSMVNRKHLKSCRRNTMAGLAIIRGLRMSDRFTDSGN